MKITNRGVTKFSTIWVFNWDMGNGLEVDNVMWDNTDHVDKYEHEYLVAIFKIKPKAK